MSHTVTIREDARAMRQGKGQHTVSAAEYATLVGSGTASPRAAHEPPDGYAIALDNLARQTSTPAPAPSVAPDGYRLALDEQRKEKK